MWTWCLWTPPRGRGYIGANPDKLKIVGDAIKTEDFGFIFQKGSRPRRTLQRRHRKHEARWLYFLSRQQVVLPVRSEPRVTED